MKSRDKSRDKSKGNSNGGHTEQEYWRGVRDGVAGPWCNPYLYSSTEYLTYERGYQDGVYLRLMHPVGFATDYRKKDC